MFTTRRFRSKLLLLSCLPILSGIANADGSEMLGTPSISIAAGSATYVAGVGLIDGPGTIVVPTIAPDETVVQAILYWEGFAQTPDDHPATDTIMVNGSPVTGDRIGGPTFFFTSGALGNAWSATYRRDVTMLIQDGATALDISGLDFTTRNNGAGLLLIVDDGVNTGTLGVKDGNDLAFINFTGDLQTTTEISFDIAAASELRVADLSVLVSSVQVANNGVGRPTIIRVKLFEGAAQIGADIDLIDKLANLDGDEWDSYSTLRDAAEDLMIPAGVDRLAVQCLSQDSGMGPFAGNLPASLVWCTATLSVPGIPTGSIGDTVFCDVNGNGVQDMDEPGIANVVVNLRCAGPDGVFETADDLVDSQMTDALGMYLFTGLPAGMCLVVADPLTVGDKLPGSCPPSFLVDLMDAEDYLDADFCFVDPPELGSIGDTVFCDVNDNGVQDMGEPGIEDVVVNLRCAGPDGMFETADDLVDSQMTGPMGTYLFSDIPAGMCMVAADPNTVGDKLPGSCPPSFTIDLMEGEVYLDADFCFIAPPEPGSIGDTVYCDFDNDGMQDPGEPGISDAVVNLTCAGPDGTFGTADDLTDSRTTDANGNYLFEEVPAGMCIVEVDTFSVPDKVPGECPTDFMIDLAEGQDFLDADFCFVDPPELACRVTGVGNATFTDDSGFHFYTLGGQIGAPSADDPQPYGNWGHSQHRGPEGSFRFHGGTNAHGDDTFIASVRCSDPGSCEPARPAPAKQLDSTGVGLFSNARDLTGLMAMYVTPSDSRHWFEVHFEDLGEPGGGRNSMDDDVECPPEGSAGTLANCGCPDFYSIRIHATAEHDSPVIYEVYGYLRHGNVQIHPPVGESGQ